jgi:glutamate---cysteine ligase / carboxylate-amine ligase
MPGNLTDTLGIAALVQCLVKALSDEIDHGTYQHDCHPIMVQQNKWRAARFGNQAMLVDTYTYEVAPITEVVEQMVQKLLRTAEELDCVRYLEHCNTLARSPSAAQQQLDILTATNDPAEVVRQLTDASRVSDQAAGSMSS